MRKRHSQSRFITVLFVVLVIVSAFIIFRNNTSNEAPFSDISLTFSIQEYSWEEESWQDRPFLISEDLNTPPPSNSALFIKYSGDAYTVLNGNKPFFDTEGLFPNPFMKLSPLDSLGRSGMAVSCVGPETLASGERESTYKSNPSGWHSIKYDFIEGGYLYNRCHLLGYMLTGENSKVENTITGTRYLNVVGMLPFELMVAQCIEENNLHVMYRVTPIYISDDLVAKGVIMEAFSLEDDGESICFCVYVHNIQPGIEIDYQTGDSTPSQQTTDARESSLAA